MKPGYKQTEIGVIPDDWEVAAIGELADITTGGRNTQDRVEDGAYPFFVRSQTIERINSYSFDGEAVLTAGDGVGTGKVFHYINGKFDVHQRVYRITQFSSRLNGYFFYLYFSNNFYGRIMQMTAKSSVDSVRMEMIARMQVPLPSSPEQSAIATALSDVDALLAGLDKLIAKKRDLKQAAMQQLLTGKTRLPEFTGEWETRLLGDVAHIKTGSRNNEDKVEDGDYPFFVRSDDVERINSYAYDCEAILVPGEGRIGEIFHYINGKFDVHQRVYAITKFMPEVSGRFVHLYMKEHFGAWAMQNTVKATVDSLRLPTFQNFEMKMPPSIEEQTAIAEVLNDMDAELAALEQRREKTRLLKQCMMQELLTGKTRLVASAAASLAATVKVIDFPSKNEKPGGKPIQQESNAGGKKANVHFIRSVLAAEIIDRLHDEPTFGHVKCEKVIYLADRLCKVDTGSHYHRDAAGPYDNRALRSIDSQLKRQQWFDAQKVDGRYRYLPMAKRGEHKQYFDRYFSKAQSVFDQIIDTFRSMRTEQCEIVATLFEAWHDLLGRQLPVSDDAIVHEVLNNWHDSKRRIDEDRWRKALDWMREKGFVPDGAEPAC